MSKTAIPYHRGYSSSVEGTTQGDPIAMAIYAIAVIPLMLMVLEETKQLQNKQTKMAAYADDLSAGGNISNLKFWWDSLNMIGPKFGYFPEASKCWLITKSKYKDDAEQIFTGSNIPITTEGKRHLGAVIGNKKHKEEYVYEKVTSWYNELILLSEIAKIEPHAAYCCFVNGYKHKLTYYMRTIPEISHLLIPIEDVIRTKFIPAITNGVFVSDEERIILSLPPKYGGLGLPIFPKISNDEYANSVYITTKLTDNIVNQNYRYEGDSELNKKKQNQK